MVPPSSDRIARVPPYSRTVGPVSRTGLSPAMARLSRRFRYQNQPPLASSAFARHYSRSSRLMSVPPATEMFQFAGFASRAYEFSAGYPARVAPWGWVAPFGDPGINDRSHLPRAFRSVPRPSSPLSAKASTRCPSFALDPKRGPAPASPPVTTPAFRKTAAHRGKRQAGSLRSFETDRSARLRRIAPLV